MKKLMLLLVPFMMYGCCVLSQVPPQTLYVDQNCQATLPDYTQIVIASDNCGEVTLYQTPEPGTIYGVDNPSFDVIVQGVDRFGLVSELIIPVTLIDTIPPVLEWPEGQVAMNDTGVINLWKNFEAAVKVQGIAKWMADVGGNYSWKPDSLQFANDTVEYNLRFFTNVIEITEDEYQEYLTYTNQ